MRTRASILAAVLCLFVQQVSAQRIVRDDDTVPLRGSVPSFAHPGADAGALDPAMPLQRIVLVLNPRPDAADALRDFLEQQQNPASSLYHHWISPREFGRRFGATDDDLNAVVAWLKRSGLRVDEVAAGRGWINFSGTANDVERVFRTPMRKYRDGDKVYHSNARDPEVPRALAPVIRGIASLNNRFPKTQHGPIHPWTNVPAGHALSPSDFATIYNTAPLLSANINGSGQTIAIVAQTEIDINDAKAFRSAYGLAANDPVIIHNGPSPGVIDDEGEADLDVQWAGAVAPNATVDLVISATTAVTDGVTLSTQYIIDNDLAPVMSISYGACEEFMSIPELGLWNSLWAQAAAQGISAFVSSGDGGVDGCDAHSATTGFYASASGLCSTPYNVCVGGSQFDDTANPSAYWSGGGAALGYIPEIAWNESGSVAGGSGLWSSGGGPSSIYSKPSWQVCPGVPNDGKRDTPDVSLTAAEHDGYLIYYHGSAYVTGGTSASSPSMAGIMALIVQKTGARQGNPNPLLYSLANAQYNGGVVLFHDVTSGNNSVPGVNGYSCGTGYDMVTGVGTINASAFVNAWAAQNPAADFFIEAGPAVINTTASTSRTLPVNTLVVGGFSAVVSLSTSSVPVGFTATLNPTTISAPGTGNTTLTVTVGAVATGTYTFFLNATGGSKSHSIPIVVNVTSGANPREAVLDGGFELTASTGNVNPYWGAIATAGHSLFQQNGGFPHSGTNYVLLAGLDDSQDLVFQHVGIPANSTAASLSFWVNVVTQEAPGTAYDFFYVDLYDDGGTFLTTIKTLSNLDSTSSSNTSGVYFKIGPLDLTAYRGKELILVFEGDTDFSLPTTFRVDDVSLQVTTTGDNPPATQITTPANGAVVSGTINVTATASDDSAVTKLDIYIDGGLKASNTNMSSLTYSWNTALMPNGIHAIVSKAYDLATNITTSKQVIVTVTNGPNAPTNLVATATSTTSITLTWNAVAGASTYQIYRKSGGGSFGYLTNSGTNSFPNSGLTPGTTYVYQVKAVDGGSNVSAASNSDLATTIIFTNDPLVANSTQIKAVHLTELRTAVNAVRAAAGLGAATFTNGSPAGIFVKAVHITELRTALDVARSALGLPALTYTDAVLTVHSTKVKTAHLQEIRAGVK